ncbi:MAG: hypothetical protein ABL308_05050 [Oceanicaulis sp.]
MRSRAASPGVQLRFARLDPMIELFAALAVDTIADDCTLDGIPLHGRVQIVEHFADFDVQVVEHFPDLKVERVSHFPDACGEWTFVEQFPDFTIRLVDHFPDFTIAYVEHFPGLP